MWTYNDREDWLYSLRDQSMTMEDTHNDQLELKPRSKLFPSN